MPYLRDYDGMKALKKKISEVHVPGYASADVAIVLFSVTGEGKYSDIVLNDYSYFLQSSQLSPNASVSGADF